MATSQQWRAKVRPAMSVLTTHARSPKYPCQFNHALLEHGENASDITIHLVTIASQWSSGRAWLMNKVPRTLFRTVTRYKSTDTQTPFQGDRNVRQPGRGPWVVIDCINVEEGLLLVWCRNKGRMGYVAGWLWISYLLLSWETITLLFFSCYYSQDCSAEFQSNPPWELFSYHDIQWY